MMSFRVNSKQYDKISDTNFVTTKVLDLLIRRNFLRRNFWRRKTQSSRSVFHVGLFPREKFRRLYEREMILKRLNRKIVNEFCMKYDQSLVFCFLKKIHFVRQLFYGPKNKVVKTHSKQDSHRPPGIVRLI